jgi:hypothetical protein
MLFHQANKLGTTTRFNIKLLLNVAEAGYQVLRRFVTIQQVSVG